MQIRNKLSLYFTITSSLLMLIIMLFIYLLFSRITKSNFYSILRERAELAAQLYLEADEIPEASVQKIKEKFVVSLPGEVIRMYDSANELSFIKDTGRNWSKKIIEEVRVKKYLAYRENKKQTVGIYYEDNQGNFVILASAIDFDGIERRKNLLQIMAILFLGQIFIQFIAGRWFAKRVLLPVEAVNEQVRKISATDLHLRVETNNERDELGRLAINFNNLLDRLEKSFHLQKTFVANASHELKTPVTNIIGEIEVALSKDRPADDYRKVLQSALSETDRLHDIIKNFLTLAAAENNAAAQNVEPVRLDELLWEIKDLFFRQSGTNLEIQLNELPDDETRLYVKTNKALLIHVVSNIIQNGLKFSKGQPVTCSLCFTGDTIAIKVTDTGIGMDTDTLQKIFEPFFRNQGSEYYPGHGIGLYMAKNIIELLGGDIQVQSEPGIGSTFNIVFKRTN